MITTFICLCELGERGLMEWRKGKEKKGRKEKGGKERGKEGRGGEGRRGEKKGKERQKPLQFHLPS